MASPQDSQYFGANFKVEMWDHDPGATTAKLVSGNGGTTQHWVDMRDYTKFCVAAMSSTLNGAGITKLEIVAADDAAGTNATVIKDSGTLVADAVGDWAKEECTAAEVAQESEDAGYNLRYVSGRITCADAADECVVTYIAIPKHPGLNHTPETTIA